MKLLYTLLLFMLCLNCKAQQYVQPPGPDQPQHMQPFVGTWEHRDGNQIFRANIWIENNYLQGHVEFIEVTTDANGNETQTIVNRSYRCRPDGLLCAFPIIFGGIKNGYLMHAQLEDNTIQDNDGYNTKRGYMSLTFQPSACQGCPVIARWKVQRGQGLKPDT